MSTEINKFQQIVYTTYYNNPREIKMPWRLNHTPYNVLLSEFMLQQTQVARVIDYFNNFLLLWPSLADLEKASLSEILQNWQGLGYNRRGKFLHTCVNQIMTNFGGEIPQNENDLQSLTGIGTYTSAAIMAFAFNQPAVVLETNIRRAIIHHFFEGQSNISEAHIREKVIEVIDNTQPRIWYWALMDYGVHLSKQVKSNIVNPNRRSKIYRKQSKFEGSNRQVRGAIIKTVLGAHIEKPTLISQVKAHITQNSKAEFEAQSLDELIQYNIKALEEEGLIASENNQIYIP